MGKDRKKNVAAAKRWNERNLDKMRDYHKVGGRHRRERLRQEVLDAYGNKCMCCGESHPEFLTIDHVHGDGKAHRKEMKKDIYLWLKQQDFPKGRFRLLCMNCNFSLGRRGYCPHLRPTHVRELIGKPVKP